VPGGIKRRIDHQARACYSTKTLRELTSAQLDIAVGGTLITEMKCKPTSYCQPTNKGCGPTYTPEC
jgi:hypothetical protein